MINLTFSGINVFPQKQRLRIYGKEYKIKCTCRKPAPGMLLQAAKDWNIDMGQSYMIGDRSSDVQAGENAGCKASIQIEMNKPYALLDALKTII